MQIIYKIPSLSIRSSYATARSMCICIQNDNSNISDYGESPTKTRSVHTGTVHTRLLWHWHNCSTQSEPHPERTDNATFVYDCIWCPNVIKMTKSSSYFVNQLSVIKSMWHTCLCISMGKWAWILLRVTSWVENNCKRRHTSIKYEKKVWTVMLNNIH